MCIRDRCVKEKEREREREGERERLSEHASEQTQLLSTDNCSKVKESLFIFGCSQHGQTLLARLLHGGQD